MKCSWCEREATHLPELGYPGPGGMLMRALVRKPGCDEHLQTLLEDVRNDATLAEHALLYRRKFGVRLDDRQTLMRWRPLTDEKVAKQARLWGMKDRGTERTAMVDARGFEEKPVKVEIEPDPELS